MSTMWIQEFESRFQKEALGLSRPLIMCVQKLIEEMGLRFTNDIHPGKKSHLAGGHENLALPSFSSPNLSNALGSE